MTAPCTHRAQHEHGSSGRYRHDGCRCDKCRAAHSRAMKVSRMRALTGGYRKTSTARVLAHMTVLAAQGMAAAAVAREAGISDVTAQRIWRGEQTTTLVDTEAAILRVRPRFEGAMNVDATGTRRRLQALATLGWSPTTLAPITGLHKDSLRLITKGQPAVESTTADAVRRVYRALLTRPRVGVTPGEKTAVLRTKRWAERQGWVGPFAWDDIDTDPAPVDVAGYKKGYRIDEIRELEGMGLTRPAIADRLGVTLDAIERAIDRANASNQGAAA